MAERPSRVYSVVFAVIALVLGWVIVRDYILDPDEEQAEPSTANEVRD